MSYITKYLQEIKRKDIIKAIKQTKIKDMKFNNVRHLKIGNFVLSSDPKGFIYGKIAVKRIFNDFSFYLTDGYEIEREKKEIEIYDEINFTVFPDLKMISFSSKNSANLFGMEVLSRVIFGEGGKIFGLTFYPQKVLDAKRRGNFHNVWFNGVRLDGKIGYTGQYGTEIDEDAKFLGNPDERDGIGVTLNSRTGKKLKVAIYKQGTLLSHTKLKDIKDNLKLEKEIIIAFLPYSNHSEKLPNKTADEFTTLQDFIEPITLPN